MRIVHFSDIHAACMPPGPSFLLDKRVLGTCNYLLRRWYRIHATYIEKAVGEVLRLKPEWIVCTGDITNLGTPAEFSRALDLLRPLAEIAGERFIYVPGNHDVYVDDPACRKALEDAFLELNGARWPVSALPVALEAGDLRFVLVNEALPVGWLLSSGSLSEADRERVEGLLASNLDDGRKNVLIGHFPTRDKDGRALGRRRRMDGADWVHNNLAEGRVAAALCGHVHRPFLRKEPSGAIEICAGSLTMSGYISVLDYVPGQERFSHFWVDVTGNDALPEPIGRELPAPS